MTSRLPRSAGRSLVHLAVSSGTAPVEDWKHSMDSFFLNFFLAKMAWNAMVCETTDVSGGNSIFPILQNTWFQAILAQKKKSFIHRVQGFYGVRRSCRARWFDRIGFQKFYKVRPRDPMFVQWCVMKNKWCWIHGEGRRGPKGATHAVLFSHSRKLAHSRGGIVLYRWNYFARKETGSSMICVPRSCCAELFAGPQRCQERWGWRCWWKASQACQNISWELMNWVLRSWKV